MLEYAPRVHQRWECDGGTSRDASDPEDPHDSEGPAHSLLGHNPLRTGIWNIPPWCFVVATALKITQRRLDCAGGHQRAGTALIAFGKL